MPAEVISADVCVIGGGAAGSTVGSLLAESGRSVVVVERGPRRRGSRRGRVDAFESVGHPIGSPERVSRIGLGGDGRVWGRAVVEFDPIDIEPRSWRAGWPITHADIARFYQPARERLGVPPRRPIFDGHGSVSIKPIDRSPVHFGEGPTGCRVLLDTAVTRITAVGDRIETAEAVSPRGPVQIRAGVFVLAAGGLATPALLLASGVGPSHLVGRFFADHPYLSIPMDLPPGAPDPSQILDGALMNPPHTLVILSEEVRREQDVPGAAASFVPYRDPAIWDHRAVDEALRLAWGVRFREMVPRPVPTFGRVIAGSRPVIRAARDKRNGWQRVALRVVVEPVADPESRISTVEVAAGPPRPRVDWRLGETGRRSVELLLSGISEAAETKGWGPIRFAADRGWPDRVEPGAHHMGGTRMGANAQTGVVDRDCRVFGTDNLYVAGPSVFPSFSYANPMLTVVALAIRLACHLEAD